MKRWQFVGLLMLLVLIVFFSTGTFLFSAEKMVYGTVVDASSGSPIPLATVQIAALQLQADAEGKFTTVIRQNKNIDLMATAAGYLPLHITFDLQWYLIRNELNIALNPAGLSMRVADAWTGDPLAGATVTVGTQSYTTTAPGMIDLTPFTLTPPVSITTQAYGYLPQHLQLNRLPQDSGELPLVILLQPTVVTGVVLAADTTAPLAGVVVSAGAITRTTDAAGHFVLPYVVAGNAITLSPQAVFLPARLTFTGESSLTVRLEPRTLTVIVRDSFSDAPIPGAAITLTTVTAITDLTGRVIFNRVFPQGSIQVSHPAYATQSIAYQQTGTLTATLKPTVMYGTIKDAVTGLPITGTRAILNGTPFTLISPTNYKLADLTRPITLTLQHNGYQTADFSIFPPDFTPQSENLTVKPCSAPLSPAAGVCLDLLLFPFIPRGIYIPFNLLSSPDTIVSLFDLVDRTELNAVIVDVKSDRGSLAWDSQVPLADVLGQDGDRPGWLTLADFVAEAHQRDIYTIARLVTFKDDPLAWNSPDLAVVYADGSVWVDGEGLAWANPFREEVWDYNIALAKEIAALGFDEINLDYLRFPSDGDLGAITYVQENTAETRTTAIRTFISRMDEALSPFPVYLSADVFGLTVWVDPQSDMNIGQRVIDLAPYIDYLCPMVYPSTFIPGNLGLDDPSAYPYQVVYRSQQSAMERVPATTRVRPWLQAYWYTTDEMLLQKQAANDAGSAGWLWWNAGGSYDEAVFGTE